MSHIFGPVASRRLGYSLGIDAVPFKICTLGCVYCQVGRTSVKTIQRKQWVAPDVIIDDLRRTLSQESGIDYITFSGSGEPTLNSALGLMIETIKDMTTIPVAVLTNGTLLFDPGVRRDLLDADLVVPSLDAVTPEIFNRINRPHEGITVDNMIKGLEDFRNEFHGRIWLEVMIVKGINDSVEELKKIAQVIKECNPDKVQINTVFRPAVESGVEPVDANTLEVAKILFGDRAEIIEEFQSEQLHSMKENVITAIIQLLKRRPSGIKEISESIGIHETIVSKYIKVLLEENRIKEIIHRGIKFYQA